MRRNLLKTALIAALPATLLMSSIAGAQQCPSQQASAWASSHQTMTVSTTVMDDDIVDIAAGAGQFNTLVAAAKAAGLVDTLKSKGPLTVFAPTDEAFKKLPEGTVETLLKPENKDKLAAILKYHVVAGSVMAADVVKLESAKSVEGSPISISVNNGTVLLNGKTKVIKTDIKASNGVVHVIDSVILPPEKKDVVDTAVAAEGFSTLVAAVKAAGLVETLKGEGPFTVFAPNDKAFGKIDEATIQSLLKPENREKLTAILTYHVVPGKVMAADVVKVESAKTVNGQPVSIKVDGDTVMVNGAKVIATDIECKNGVIHVIDSVIMPK